MQALLDFLGRGFSGGRLDFQTPDGRRWSLGSGYPQARVLLRNQKVLRRILRNPELNLGETYMDGLWEPGEEGLLPILGVGVRLADHWQRRYPAWAALGRIAGRIGELNDAVRSRSNVSHHYDVDDDLYQAFLDADLHYSCGYFAEGVRTLEQAQQAKCELIARKLDLKPGAEVLDIGCGWGGLAMYLAQHHRARVTGITLSQSQYQTAVRRVQERGLESQVEIRLQDYRQVRGQFDAVVSVGMFEHVGRPQYQTYFEDIRELLKPEGVALVHTIGRRSPPGSTNRWIRKYIFPGGYIPAASEALEAIEHSELGLTDLEIWRLHYAQTLAEWHRRFQQVRSEVAERRGVRFCRMWEFYLQCSEASFRWGDLVVFHLQLARSLERLPLTRDYLYREPAAQRTSRARLISVEGRRR